MSDSFKKLRAEMEIAPKNKRQAKANRTFSLSEPQTSVFIRYCRAKDRPASEVIDRLIALFLEEVKDDLPVDRSDDGAA